MMIGMNMYTIIGGMVAAALLLHLTSKEETIIAIVATVAIIYMTR